MVFVALLDGHQHSNPSSDDGDDDIESNESESNNITRERLQALLDIAEEMLPDVILKKRKHFERRLIDWKYNRSKFSNTLYTISSLIIEFSSRDQKTTILLVRDFSMH